MDTKKWCWKSQEVSLNKLPVSFSGLFGWSSEGVKDEEIPKKALVDKKNQEMEVSKNFLWPWIFRVNIPISHGCIASGYPGTPNWVVHEWVRDSHIPNHRHFCEISRSNSLEKAPGLQNFAVVCEEFCCHVLVDADHIDGRPGLAAWKCDGGWAVAMQRAYAGGASRDVKVPQHPELWYSFFLGGGDFWGDSFGWRLLLWLWGKQAKWTVLFFLTVLEHGQVDCWIMWDV